MTSYVCFYCNQPYTPITKSQKNRPRKYCSTLCQRTHKAETVRNSNILKYNESPKACVCCGIVLPYDQRNNKYCSLTCSAKINNSLRPPMSEDRRKKQGEILRKYQHKRIIKKSNISWCKYCGIYLPNSKRVMCNSSICKHIMLCEAGKISAQKQIRRSKDEIKLFELCEKYFNNCDHNTVLVDGWDADIVIHDIKTAVLWNGPWHYKDMKMKNHSLLQVQTRDKIKTEVLRNNGWNVIIFRDDEYTPETAFDLLQAVAGAEIESAEERL